MSNEEKSNNNCLKLSGYVFLLTNIVLFWNALYLVLLPNVFLEVNNDYQIILGLLLPIVKELSFRNYCHYASKIGLQESTTFEIAWHSHMETTHAQFLSIILGNITNTETSYCILAMDFIANVINCLRIIYRIKYKDSMHRGK